ncbi:MAG: helix-turn-helix domain-containing protein [Paracoccaceae bacterium]
MTDPTRPSALRQDPHATRAPAAPTLEAAIGREVRAHRLRHGLTVAQLAGRADLSSGMLSKIENGLTSPSLTTLQSLAAALSVPLTALLRGWEGARDCVHTPAGEGVDVARAGTRAGHQYRLLGHLGATAAGVTVEPYLIELTDASDVFPTFQHAGVETIHMLSGAIDYRHGDAVHPLRPGDTLFFDADAPHGPERLVELPARYLSVIAYAEP